MVPLMVELLKIRQHQAHGTSLVAIVFIGLVGAIAYSLESSVDFVAALALACTSMLTARLGANLTSFLPEWKLKRYFGASLAFIAFLLAIKTYIPHIHFSNGLVWKVLVLLIAGALTGFLSGMMGVGGGVIMVPVMVLIVGLNQHTAQGTSLLVMVPTGAVGALTHWKLGHVDWKIVPGLMVGVMLGTPLGARLAHLIPEHHLRLLFAFFMLSISVRYLVAKPEVERKELAKAK